MTTLKRSITCFLSSKSWNYLEPLGTALSKQNKKQVTHLTRYQSTSQVIVVQSQKKTKKKPDTSIRRIKRTPLRRQMKRSQGPFAQSKAGSNCGINFGRLYGNGLRFLGLRHCYKHRYKPTARRLSVTRNGTKRNTPREKKPAFSGSYGENRRDNFQKNILENSLPLV